MSNNNDDDDTMGQDELIGGNQPSITDYFPQANNLTVDEFRKDFSDIGKRYVTNLENGVLLEYENIVGFFCRAAEQGYDIQINNLSPLGMYHISNIANKILQFNNTSPEPYWDNDNDIELLPTSIVTAIAIKSRYNATDTSFFTGFYEAFKLMMTNKLTNEERRQWAKKSLTNLDINYPLLRSLVSPTKK